MMKPFLSVNHSNGVFTLSGAMTDKETYKKVCCIELSGGVHATQRRRLVQIPIGISANLSVSLSRSGAM